MNQEFVAMDHKLYWLDGQGILISNEKDVRWGGVHNNTGFLMHLHPSNVHLLDGKLGVAQILIARDVVQSPSTFVALLKLLKSKHNNLRTLYLAGFFPHNSVKLNSRFSSSSYCQEPTKLRGVSKVVHNMSGEEIHYEYVPTREEVYHMCSALKLGIQ